MCECTYIHTYIYIYIYTDVPLASEVFQIHSSTQFIKARNFGSKPKDPFAKQGKALFSPLHAAHVDAFLSMKARSMLLAASVAVALHV